MRALLLLVCVLQEADLKPLLDARRALRETKAAAAAALVAAHDALDARDYDGAVAKRKLASELDAKAGELRKKEEMLAADAANAFVKALMSDDIDVRERASASLVVVGPSVTKLLETVRKTADAEVRGRLDRVLRLLRDVEVDDDGRLRQWAAAAKASSEYTADACAAKQAAGKPDTKEAGDKPTAWAPAAQDAGIEWIELTYEVAVRPARVRIHETCGPGTVVKIEALDPDGKWHELWKGADPSREAPAWFDPEFAAPAFATKAIRVTVDTSLVAGWNEVDAVELIGSR
jgi:hypothetical protein